MILQDKTTISFCRLVELGAKVMVCDKIVAKSIDEDTTSTTGSGSPPDVHFVQCDVADKTSFEAAFKATEEKLGKVEVLVNNAGILRENNYEGTRSQGKRLK